MPFELPLHSSLAAQKQEVLATAAQLVLAPSEANTPEGIARHAAVDAVQIHWSRRVKRAIEECLDQSVENYIMIEGEFDEAADALEWHGGLETAALNGLACTTLMPLFGAMRELLVDSDLFEAGRRGEVAQEMAALIVESSLPQAKDTGKWLSAVGIAKAELEWLAAQTKTAVAGAVQQWREEVACLPPGTTPSSPPAVAPAAFLTPPATTATGQTDVQATEEDLQVPAPGTGPAPDAAAISHAYQLIYEPSSANPDSLATALGVSRSTMMNWLSGRTAKAKCNVEQARALLANVEARIACLHEASVVFAAIRG
jgi:hypothetical protein